MLELAVPDRSLHRSFLAAADEFIAEGLERYANLPRFPADDGFAGMTYTRGELEQPAAFARYAAWLAAQADPAAPRPHGIVPWTERWLVVDGCYVGRISLRHELTDVLLTWGGHVGYAVRPSARGRGHASEALRRILPVAADVGLPRVLVTCDVDNGASRRTIERVAERQGGGYEDTRQGKRRYWISTGADRRAAAPAVRSAEPG